MDAIKIVKTVISIPMGIGLGAIIDNVIKITTPEETGRAMRVAIKFGAYGLGAAAMLVSKNAVDQQIDDVVTAVNLVMKPATAE